MRDDADLGEGGGNRNGEKVMLLDILDMKSISIGIALY